MMTLDTFFFQTLEQHCSTERKPITGVHLNLKPQIRVRSGRQLGWGNSPLVLRGRISFLWRTPI